MVDKKVCRCHWQPALNCDKRAEVDTFVSCLFAVLLRTLVKLRLANFFCTEDVQLVRRFSRVRLVGSTSSRPGWLHHVSLLFFCDHERAERKESQGSNRKGQKLVLALTAAVLFTFSTSSRCTHKAHARALFSVVGVPRGCFCVLADAFLSPGESQEPGSCCRDQFKGLALFRKLMVVAKEVCFPSLVELIPPLLQHGQPSGTRVKTGERETRRVRERESDGSAERREKEKNGLGL